VVDYRIYRLNGEGDILTGFDADCTSDEAAYAVAKHVLKKGGRAEVWERTRFVGQVSKPGPEFGRPFLPRVQKCP